MVLCCVVYFWSVKCVSPRPQNGSWCRRVYKGLLVCLQSARRGFVEVLPWISTELRVLGQS